MKAYRIILLLLPTLLFSACAADAPSILSGNDGLSVDLSNSDVDMAQNSNPVEIQNPYQGTSELIHSWHYDVFEIFRGANEVKESCILDYSTTLIDSSDAQIEQDFYISFPQFDAHNEWAKNINNYLGIHLTKVK